MKNRKIILWLIVQDIRHLRVACPQCYHEIIITDEGLTIFQIIIKLFEVSEQLDKTDLDKLGEFYYNFLESLEGQKSPLTDEGFQLRAEHCFELIAACIHMRSIAPKLNTFPE